MQKIWKVCFCEEEKSSFIVKENVCTRREKREVKNKTGLAVKILEGLQKEDFICPDQSWLQCSGFIQ